MKERRNNVKMAEIKDQREEYVGMGNEHWKRSKRE
jgi:hypothetical protein